MSGQWMMQCFFQMDPGGVWKNLAMDSGDIGSGFSCRLFCVIVLTGVVKRASNRSEN
jgi:hypothetical protein